MKEKFAFGIAALVVAASVGGIVLNGSKSVDAATSQTSSPKTITVVGSADEQVSPDSVQVSAGVLSKATTAVKAESENNQQMNKIIAMLKAAGIPDKNIQTQWFNIQPNYANGSPDIVGFQVDNNINIDIPNMKQVGTIVDDLVKDGVNQINNVNYYVSNPSKIQQNLYSLALDNARSQADSIAKKLGVNITGVQSVTTESGGGVIMPMYGFTHATASAASEKAVLSPGTQDISTSLTVVYTIN